MKTLSIDIETYSDVDLNKCGVYKYAESEAFDILLFAYSVDDGAVKVVDMANGEAIPKWIVEAIFDENVIKYAFNAAFERVCLSHYFDTLLSPKSWRCTMVWSAYMGLPLSLKGVGAVLKLDEQKMVEGKELIKYFCSPCAATKSNGGRTRNMPFHAVDKWGLFKRYNKRDVVILAEKFSGSLRYSPSTDYLVYNGSFWEESKPKAQAVVQKLTALQLCEVEKQIKQILNEMCDMGMVEILASVSPKKAETVFDDDQLKIYKKFVAANDYKSFVLKRRNSNFITSALKEARPMLEINPRDLDANEFLLITPNFTIDLTSGDEIEHEADNYITKQTTVD